MKFFSLLLVLISCCNLAMASEKKVRGLIINGLEQKADDEEAPFEIRARNKVHKCGGKSSNLFRIFSEYETVGQRRFLLALTAMERGWKVTLETDGCDGRALSVKSIRIEH